MGSGALLTKGKEIILILPSSDHRLSCGCMGQEAFKFRDKDGNFIYEKVDEKYYSDFDHHMMPFQSKDWDNFWNNFYEKYPSKKPILINNA